MHLRLVNFSWLRKLFRMFNKTTTETEHNKPETIQEIAVKLVTEQMRLLQHETDPVRKERTIFVLGSKGVGKSTVLNKFFDREENTRPTLALEYSYGRRTGGTTQKSQKQVLNVWELGSLENAQQLIEVPLRTHGVEHFAAIIMLDLSQPQRVWLDLECAYRGFERTCAQILSNEQMQRCRERMATRLKKEHIELDNLELLPFPVVIIGGKYDMFMDFGIGRDHPELKKHVCRCLRSLAHLIGGSLLFYSSKIPKLTKTLRDTVSHLGFGSPSNPFRAHVTDYNDALSIWFGMDNWESIGSQGSLSVERIGALLAVEVPQLNTSVTKRESTKTLLNPAKDAGFRESVIDEMRVQKDEELATIIRDSQLRGKFETIII